MTKRALLPVFAVLSLIVVSSAGAQENLHRRASLLLGIGGGLYSDEASGFSNQSFQLGLSFETERDTLVGFRYGQLAFDDGLDGDGFSTADLSYLTVAGEYRFNEGYYESGLFLGVGAYDLETRDARGSDDDTGIGATLGVTGEFRVSRRVAVLVELSLHWADLDAVNLFSLGHAGMVVRW